MNDLTPALPESSANSSEHLHALLRFARVLRYRQGYVLGAVMVAALLGALYYVTAPRIYRAQASVMVTPKGNDLWTASITTDVRRDSLIPTYERLFTQAVVLDGAVEKIRGMAPEITAEFEELPADQWTKHLGQNLSARSVKRTRFVELSYRSHSPAAAEAILDAVLQSYLEFIDRSHRSISVDIIGKLEEERQRVEGELQEKQQALLEVRQNVKMLGINDAQNTLHPLVQRVVDLNQKLTEVQKLRLELQATLDAIQSARDEGHDLRQFLLDLEPTVGRELIVNSLGLHEQSSESIENVERKLLQERSRLAAWEQHLGENHPSLQELRQSIRDGEQYVAQFHQDVRARLTQAEEQRLAPMIVAMVQQKLAKAVAQEKVLLAEYQSAEQAAVMLNKDMAGLVIAERAWERANSLHDSLLERIAQLDIAQDHADIQVTPARHPKAASDPVSPQLATVAVLCLAAGLAVGICIVYVLDLVDDRFRSPEEIQTQLRTNILAMVRKLPEDVESGMEAVHVHARPESVESEAFRTLRTTLAFSEEDLNRLAITSTEPSDGKTTVISNLGVTYAHAGKRTLLIDADLRRPGLTKLFELKRNHGVSDVLRSRESVESLAAQCVRSTALPQLDVLPCGPKPPNPAELLSSRRFADLVAWAEANYDQVLIDCPPALAAADAAIVGQVTDGMIMVIQPEKNHRRLVTRAVQSIRSMNVKLVGVVANRVGSDKSQGYYDYGYGYSYSYGDAANSDSEDDFGAMEETVAGQHLAAPPARQPAPTAATIAEPLAAPSGQGAAREAALDDDSAATSVAAAAAAASPDRLAREPQPLTTVDVVAAQTGFVPVLQERPVASEPEREDVPEPLSAAPAPAAPSAVQPRLVLPPRPGSPDAAVEGSDPRGTVPRRAIRRSPSRRAA